MASLFQAGPTAGTVKSYLSSVCFTQISLGLGDPHAVVAMPQLEYVVKGVKKKTAARSNCPQLPITVQILSMLLKVWETVPDEFNASMLACMCFFWIFVGR